MGIFFITLLYGAQYISSESNRKKITICQLNISNLKKLPNIGGDLSKGKIAYKRINSNYYFFICKYFWFLGNLFLKFIDRLYHKKNL